MAEQTRRARTVTRLYRADIGGTWWGALVVVTVVLGFVGRGDGGFWGAFLWSVVGFVVGTLVAIAISSRVVGARSEAEAFADVDDSSSDGTVR
ncbi:hypothetical protein ACWEOW_08795 [Monashia sp. NPDC004114]